MGLDLRTAAFMLTLMALVIAGGCALDPMEELGNQIQSQEVGERTTAIIGLANLNDQRATEELLGVLEKDDELFDLAAVALVKKGREIEQQDPEAMNRIVEDVGKILSNAHLAERFRAQAAWTLGEIGSRDAVPVLLTGTVAKVGAAAAALVRQYSKQGLEKLGYYSEGRAYEVPMGTLVGELDILPEPEPLALPEAE